MGIAEDMKKIAEEIVSSYQSRICTVATIIDDTHNLLEDFRAKRDQMSGQLKEMLAKEGSLRRKDFDSTMKDLFAHQDEREKEVKHLLRTFFEEHKEVAELIKKNLTGEEKIGISDFKKRLQDIQAKQKAREQEVATTLRDFQKEYKEMAAALRSLLDKGEAIRIHDFKEMVKDLCGKQAELAKEAEGSSSQLKGERTGMVSPWDSLVATMAKKEPAI